MKRLALCMLELNLFSSHVRTEFDSVSAQVTNIRLAGVEHVLQFTAVGSKVSHPLMSVFRSPSGVDEELQNPAEQIRLQAAPGRPGGNR